VYRFGKVEETLLSLIRSALFDDSQCIKNIRLSDEEWKKLLTIADRQSVTCIVSDGISKLPKEQQPSIKICEQLKEIRKGAEMLYYNHLKLLNYLLIRLQTEVDIDVILLKGLGLSLFYPIPSHRTCGDIDLYFGGEDKSESVNRIISKWGVHVNEMTDGESNFNLNGIVVENHGRLLTSHNPFRRRNRQVIENSLNKENAYYLREIDGVPVNILTPSYNNLLLTTHSLKHLLNEGIGLRQMCDVAVFLKSEKERIDGNDLKEKLEKWGVKGWANLCYSFAVKHLGMPESYLPYRLNISAYNSDKLLQSILDTGDFIASNPNGTYQKQGLGHALGTAKRIYMNTLLFVRYAPGEALGFSVSTTWKFIVKLITGKKL